MKRLILDIETAPNIALVWSLFKYTVPIEHIVEPGYTLCWAAKWVGEKGVMFGSIPQDGNKKMIKRVYDLLCEADAVIHYNGKKFDIPTLNREFVLNGLTPPDTYKQIDLYHVVRQNFRFPSNKLDYVLKALGIGAKVPNKGMQLWIDCMNGDPKAWKQMERYNKGDVSPLEGLYNRLLPWIKQHPNFGLYVDTDRPTCTNCGSHHVVKKGLEYTKTQRYQRYKCKDCGTPLRGRFTEVSKKQRSSILTQA